MSDAKAPAGADNRLRIDLQLQRPGFALEVQICDKDTPSEVQLQKADATMPAHRHGMNYRPVIKPLGVGRYRVEGMMFHMAGQWELAFEVKSGRETLRLSQEVHAD